MTASDGRSPDTVDTVLLKELASRVEAAHADSGVEVFNAMTGRPLGDVPRCTSADVAAAAERARAIQPAWAARPIRERAEVLLRFHDLVLQHQDEVLDLIQLENGKARRHAFEEVLDVCLTARYYANTAADVRRAVGLVAADHHCAGDANRGHLTDRFPQAQPFRAHQVVLAARPRCAESDLDTGGQPGGASACS